MRTHRREAWLSVILPAIAIVGPWITLRLAAHHTAPSHGGGAVNHLILTCMLIDIAILVATVVLMIRSIRTHRALGILSIVLSVLTVAMVLLLFIAEALSIAFSTG